MRGQGQRFDTGLAFAWSEPVNISTIRYLTRMLNKRGMKDLMREAFEKRAEAKVKALRLSGRIRRDYSRQAAAGRVVNLNRT